MALIVEVCDFDKNHMSVFLELKLWTMIPSHARYDESADYFQLDRCNRVKRDVQFLKWCLECDYAKESACNILKAVL
jgi:hypothetical protein